MPAKTLVSALKRGLKRLINSRARIILFYILKNYSTRLKTVLFHKGFSDSASTYRIKSLEQSLSLLDNAYQRLLAGSTLTGEELKRKRLLEIGPGENLGLALKFISAGAEQVVCLDKYYAARDQEKEYQLYTLLRSRLNQDQKKHFDDAISLESGKPVINRERLICIYGTGIDEEQSPFTDATFDIIYSNAVLEHVFHLTKAFLNMDKLLKPGGHTLHIVDFKDHGLFSSEQLHALEFLTVPPILYKLMSQYIALPNRQRINFYRSMLARLKYQSRIYIQQLINFTETSLIADGRNINLAYNPDSGSLCLKTYKEQLSPDADYSEEMINYIKKIMPRLTRSFRSLTAEELLIGTIIISARKPADSEIRVKQRTN